MNANNKLITLTSKNGALEIALGLSSNRYLLRESPAYTTKALAHWHLQTQLHQQRHQLQGKRIYQMRYFRDVNINIYIGITQGRHIQKIH